MNAIQLRAFQAVASEASFTRAARALGVSQPTISAHVKALEETYQVELLRRRGRSVEPTELGRELLAIASRIVGLDEEAEDLLEAAHALEAGHLRAGADSPHHVVSVLSVFRDRHPLVRLSLKMGSGDDVLADLLDHRTDVAVLAEVAPHPRLVVRQLLRSRLVAFVPLTHPWATRGAISIHDLEGQPMVRRASGSRTRAVLDRALAEAGVEPRVAIEIGSREAAHVMVAAGFGVGVVSEAELGASTHLAPLVLSDAAVDMTQCVVCLRERRRLRVVRAFMDIADELRAAVESSPRTPSAAPAAS